MRKIGKDNNDKKSNDNVFGNIIVKAMGENVSIINKLYVIHIYFYDYIM